MFRKGEPGGRGGEKSQAHFKKDHEPKARWTYLRPVLSLYRDKMLK